MLNVMMNICISMKKNLLSGCYKNNFGTKWLPQALGKSIPYAPNYLDIYYNNTYVLLERVSLYFIMYIKRKCFKAKLKIKHQFMIFIGIPIILVLIALFIVLIAQLGR